MSTPPTPVRTRAALLGVAIALAGLAGCGSPSASSSTGGSAGATGSASGTCSQDAFPVKVHPSAATNFTVEYHGSYAVVTVKKPNPTDGAESYVLTPCATRPAVDPALAKAQVITVPVRTVDAVSVTQIASLQLLDALPTLVGVGDAAGLSNPQAVSPVKSGAAADLSSKNGDFDLEKAAATRAGLMFQSGMANPSYAKLRSLGVPTVADGSWLEATPLGRAEWVKFYGLFLGKEQQANSTYQQINDGYARTLARVKTARSRPKVLVGAEFQGTWSVPRADAYVARYVADAGGDYVFSSLPGTGTAQLDAEKVFTAGQQASIWINGNWMSRQRWKTRADALALDARYAELPAFAKGQVWNPTRRISANGANDYWESGVVRPDLVLADLAQVFHPELAAGRQPYYYQQLQP